MALTLEQEQNAEAGIPPSESDYREVAEEMVPELPEAPVGTYSKPRLGAFLKAINACAATGGVPPIEMEVEEVRKQPLPIEIFQGYLACRAIGEAFIEAIPEATLPDMPDAMSLVDDASLAQATSGIQSLIGDREYKKWVRESETPEPAEEALTEETMMEEDVSPEAATELAALL